MSAKSSDRKYYFNRQDIRNQLPTLVPIVLMFIITVVYASGFKNPTVRTVFLYMSLGYPAIILFSLLGYVPKLNYCQLNPDGIRVTTLGFFHRDIYWSDIESVGPATMGKIEGIGIAFIPSFKRHRRGRKLRQMMSGWDEVLPNAHTKNGTSLADEVVKRFGKHLGKPKK